MGISIQVPITMAPFDNVQVTVPYVLDVLGFEPPRSWSGPRGRTMAVTGGGERVLCVLLPR